MPKRSRKAVKTASLRDVNQTAFDVVQEIDRLMARIDPDGKDPLAVALGRRGGLKGGRARADGMTASERSKSAKKAAKARWAAKTTQE
jgi:hypothetical protein